MASHVGARFVSTGKLLNRGSLLAIALVAVVLVHDGVGVARVFQLAASGKRDLTASLRYVGEKRQPGEWVVSAIPPPMSAYTLKSAANLAFLPGGEMSNRTLRYTRLSPEGFVRDYWIGVPALPTFRGFCGFLAEQPNSWLVVPKTTWNTWGYSGGSQSRNKRLSAEMRDIVEGTSSQQFSDRQAFVFHVNPVEQWSSDANELCGRSVNKQSRKSQSGG